jgi:hypothetical protein
MNHSASSITSPRVSSRENASAIGGEAIVSRLRGEAPAALPLSPPRKGDTAAGAEKALPRSLRQRAILVAPGTGAQFALLPPENATGNFTKIVQCVPVKIVLDDGDPRIQRLRPGLSAEAIVDTRGRSDQGPSNTITLGALKAEDAQP